MDLNKILKLKSRINKSNGQINLNIRKKDLPLDLRKIAGKIKSFNMKVEGIDL